MCNVNNITQQQKYNQNIVNNPLMLTTMYQPNVFDVTILQLDCGVTITLVTVLSRSVIGEIGYEVLFLNEELNEELSDEFLDDNISTNDLDKTLHTFQQAKYFNEILQDVLIQN